VIELDTSLVSDSSQLAHRSKIISHVSPIRNRLNYDAYQSVLKSKRSASNYSDNSGKLVPKSPGTPGFKERTAKKAIIDPKNFIALNKQRYGLRRDASASSIKRDTSAKREITKRVDTGLRRDPVEKLNKSLSFSGLKSFRRDPS
jgi:hypothetical protein